MIWVDKLKMIIQKINPIAHHRRKKMRKALKNTTPSFLVPNCVGGILFHDLGIRFFSPTVNLMMKQTDFVKFVCNLDYYKQQPLRFFCSQKHSCPCAYLDDIVIYFIHFTTEEEAESKWYERMKRINKDNLFICALERDGLTKEDIQKLGDLKVRGIVVFTANDYPDIPYALYLPQFHKKGEIGNIMLRNYIDDSRDYEKWFDFVKWFNQANGGKYDIKPFSRL